MIKIFALLIALLVSTTSAQVNPGITASAKI